MLRWLEEPVSSDDLEGLAAVRDAVSADVAAAHGLQISGHCAPHLHAAVAAAAPNLRHLEWFHDHARIELQYFDGAVLPLDGLLRLDGKSAGHGLTVRRQDLETLRVR